MRKWTWPPALPQPPAHTRLVCGIMDSAGPSPGGLCAPPEASSAKRWSAVATVAKTKELKKRYGAEEGEESERDCARCVPARSASCLGVSSAEARMSSTMRKPVPVASLDSIA